MEFFTKHKTLIYAGLGIGLLALGWYAFSGSSSSSSLLSTQNIEGRGPDASVVETLLKLRAVSLSATIFSDPAFTALRDFGTQIVPEPVGRPNPFAPLPSSVHPTSSPRTSQLFKQR